MRAAILAGFGVAWQVTTASAEVELKNDGFNSGDAVGFQGGFVSGEIGASRFVAPEPGRTLLKVQLLFGPDDPSPRTVTLRVYDDTAGTNTPGTMLYFNDFQLMGSNSAMHEIATTDMPVTLPQQFRVGIEFQHSGAPSIAGDKDGTRTSGRNFIFAIPGGWIEPPFPPSSLGDWIIRAFVSDGGGGTDGPGGGDAGVPVGGPCASNPDCPTGQFCDTGAGACTFECRLDEDCGGGICNSLGQCVGGDGGGCCETGRGSGSGAMIGAGFLGVLFFWRRGRNRSRGPSRTRR